MSTTRQANNLHHCPRKQHGAALMVMLVIMVMGAAAFLVSSLSKSALDTARQETTSAALAQAKEALIGKSASYTDYPGSLPCPDTDDDGTSDAGGSTECPQYIGRLPWKTIGLPDLRDAAGERLWYTLSRNVRRYDSVRPLNSDTTGTLNITGTYTGSNLIAIVFAPGSTTSTQRRSTTQTALCSTTGTTIPESWCAANYLEGSNDDPSNSSTQNLNYQNENTAAQLNDQLVTISHDQLFMAVEKRVGGEFRNHLKNYHESWGAFPFAALFSNPLTADYRGVISIYEGLYPFGGLIFVNPDDSSTHPIGSSPSNPEWVTSPSPTIAFSSGTTPAFTCEVRDSNWNNSRVRCTADSPPATLPVGVTVTMSAKLKDVGLGFWKPFSLDVNNNNVLDSAEQVRVRDEYGNYQLAKTIFDPSSISVTGTLNYSDGSATVRFSAKGKSGGSKFQRIDLRNIEYERDSLPFWIKDNEWHKLLYYAVSPSNAPAGSGGSSITCSPSNTPPCLILYNKRNDVKAVVIMTGRNIAGGHPSANLNDYLEGQNQTPADYTFENQPRSATFNDQVIVVAP